MLTMRTGNCGQHVAVFLVGIFLASLTVSMVPGAPSNADVLALKDERVIAPTIVPQQTYELYLDTPSSETGGQGSITTIEPTGSVTGISAPIAAAIGSRIK